MATRLITTAELLEAPTGIDWTTVSEAGGPTDPSQFIEQSLIIDRASAWAGSWCQQPLGLHATQLTETGRTSPSAFMGTKAWVDRSGFLHFKADTLPVLSVVSTQYTSFGIPQAWTAIPVSNWFIEGPYPQQRHLVEPSKDWTYVKQVPTLLQVTYISGWANAVLTVNATSGSNVNLAVDTSLGMSVGQALTVYDGSNTEPVTVTAVPDATHVTVAALAKNHSAGVGVSAVPSDMKEAVILAAVHFARERGTEVVAMQGTHEGAAGPKDDDLAMAEYLLQQYRAEV